MRNPERLRSARGAFPGLDDAVTPDCKVLTARLGSSRYLLFLLSSIKMTKWCHGVIAMAIQPPTARWVMIALLATAGTTRSSSAGIFAVLFTKRSEPPGEHGGARGSMSGKAFQPVPITSITKDAPRTSSGLRGELTPESLFTYGGEPGTQNLSYAVAHGRRGA